MGDSGDPTLQLPIDVSFSKLGDWLVDRKRIPADWRKRLLPIRAKISSALPALPKDLDPSFPTLTSEGVGYLETKHILDVLTTAKPEARNLFGRLSGTAGDWDTIVRAYEKEFLFLGEAAQILVQNVNYEIPYLKKQITKLQQQLGDTERKETEYRRNAVAAAVKYQQSCQELGIKGVNVRSELLETSKKLPSVFSEVESLLRNDLVGQAIECYESFVSYAYNDEQGKCDALVKSLRKLRDNVDDTTSLSNNDTNGSIEKPEDSDLTTCNSEVNEGIEVQKEKVAASEKVTESQEVPEAAINFDGVIDWDTGNIENTLGDAIQWDTGNVDDSQIEMPSEIQWDISTDNTNADESGIQWDISIEDIAEFSADSNALQSDNHAAEVQQDHVVIPSKFMETEYRNNLLDDLMEIHSFLALKIDELNRQETASLQNQVQAISPQTLQQYGSDSFQTMKSEILKAINLLTNKEIRDLIMIVTSQRFLKRLEDSLNHKKQQESKLLENVKELAQKQLELRSTLAAIWPKQEAALRRTKEIKEHCEKTISTMYNGRRINIIGEINSILGQG